jgi:murein L,D-transpeptidase YcbB/YkuD
VLAGRHPSQRWPRLDDVAGALRSLYDGSGWTPLWSRDGVPTAAAHAVIAELGRLEGRGLDPADFDSTRLQKLASTRVARSPLTGTERVEFDLTLSSGTLRALHSLRYGRISAHAAHAHLQFTREPYDEVVAVRSMTTTTNPSLQLDAAEPPYVHYRLLLRALARYRELARDTTLVMPVLRRTLHPDSSDTGVPRLRRLLVALGDLPILAAHPVDADTLRYDSALVRGVKAFQLRHAIAADGVIGPETLARIRHSLAAHVMQIIVTLERWRWLPHTLGPSPIFVNVPSFQLYAFTSNFDRESDVLSMAVIVGQAFDHKTPLFSGALRQLVFSPYWDVPPSIARKEILPKARRDPAYLDRNHYEIVDRSERIISPLALDAVANGRARIRQRPGTDNALGGVKFIFPNAFNVYMHDTPTPQLFERVRRDFSHGCIRLADPARLAQFLLRDQPEWNAPAIAAAMQRPRPLYVELRTPVPVHVMYGTAIAREDGMVLFHDDIYGHDRSLQRLLAAGYPYPP